MSSSASIDVAQYKKELKDAKQLILDLLHETKAHPIMIRLAWHDSGTYNKDVEEFPTRAGANGSLRFAKECGYACNSARLDSAVKLLEPVKEKVPNVTWADLFQMASALAVQDAGGPKIQMQYGREDCSHEDMCAANGTLPAGAAPWPNDKMSPQEHLREVFYRQGFNDQEIVALSGAHTLGRAHASRSGLGKDKTKYTDGGVCPMGVRTAGGSSWTKNWLKFDNEYFTDIKERSDPELLVLETDRCLFEDPKFKPHAERYAADQDNFFAEYAAAHKKLAEQGAKWLDGTPITLEE